MLLTLAASAWAQPSLPRRETPTEVSERQERESLGTILLVRTDGDERVVAHLRAELRASAWTVIEIGTDGRGRRFPLAELAAQQSTTAALRVYPDEAKIELWVAEPLGSTDGTLELLEVEGLRPDARVLALRATEALRARGRKLERASASPMQRPPSPPTLAPPLAPVSPPAQAPQPPAPTTSDSTAAAPALRSRGTAARESVVLALPVLWLEVAPTGELSAGGLGPALDGWLGARVQLTRSWSLAIFGLVPVWSDPLLGSEGSARISTWMFGVAADLHAGTASWMLSGGVGAGGVLSRMSGNAPAPFTATNESITAAAAFGRVSAHLALGSSLRMFVRVVVGASMPEITVRFAERDAARWGRPFALAALGVEYPLFEGK